MRNLLITLFLIAPAFAFAQNDTSKYIPREQYCMLTVTNRSFSTKVYISVDYGQETKYFGLNTNRAVKDSKGRIIDFNSVVDALNYMSSQGWLFVNAYPITDGGFNYLMRKPLNQTNNLQN